jgi:hypothetical protein
MFSTNQRTYPEPPVQLHLFFTNFQNPELKVITKSKICTTLIKTQIPVTISNKESHVETRGVSHGGLAICIKK